MSVRATYAAFLALGLVVGGLLGAFLMTYPGTYRKSHTYCTRCALHRDREVVSAILRDNYSASGEHADVLHAIIGGLVGEHDHQWMDPPAIIFPLQDASDTAEGFERQRSRLAYENLRQIEESPQALSLLYQAAQSDPVRTQRLVHRILDPTAHLEAGAVLLLDRDVPWDERWRIVDAFLQSYKCEETRQSVSCTLPFNGERKLVYQQTGKSYSGGGISWLVWTP